MSKLTLIGPYLFATYIFLTFICWKTCNIHIVCFCYMYREHEDTARLVCRAHGVPAPTIRSGDRQTDRHTNRQTDKYTDR